MVCVNVGIVVDKNGCCAGNGAKKSLQISAVSVQYTISTDERSSAVQNSVGPVVYAT